VAPQRWPRGEWRKTYVNTPSQTGTADGSVFASYNGGYTQDEDVGAIYGEILLPVIKTLELSAAVRYDHYDKFDSTTPKVSAKWTPIQQVALRASYAEGFRAPNAAESSVGHLAAFGSAGAYDPIRCPTARAPRLARRPRIAPAPTWPARAAVTPT
jgi:iron complex outermembrane receptor protein